jgi:hypothetical protein
MKKRKKVMVRKRMEAKTRRLKMMIRMMMLTPRSKILMRMARQRQRKS